MDSLIAVEGWRLEGAERELGAHFEREESAQRPPLGGGAVLAEEVELAAILVVDDGAQHEYLIPMAGDIVLNVDIPGKKILIDPPEGLLEL